MRPELAGLRRLAPTDAFVRALVVTASRGLRGGLEAAWDARAALGPGGAIDVERAAAFLAGMAAPRGFWVPARALAKSVGLALPASLLARAPGDARQRRLERIAAGRLFTRGPSGPVAESLLRWAWPALAAHTTAGVVRRLPRAAARAAREVPGAWREIEARDGLAGAVREAGRAVRAWAATPGAR